MQNEALEVRAAIDKIEGWLTIKEGEALFHMARRCTGKGVIVEIGSWKGKSTVCLAKGSAKGPNAKVYAIDPHTGTSEHKRKYGEVWTFDEMRANIAEWGVDNLVVPLVKTSEEASRGFDEPIELLLIDGAHEYEFVSLDFELWFPKVIEGGTVVFHDSHWPGPTRVIRERVLRSNRFRNVMRRSSLTIAEKVAENSLKDRARNRLLLATQNYPAIKSAISWQLRRIMNLPGILLGRK